jgi:hypothetical protein
MWKENLFSFGVGFVERRETNEMKGKREEGKERKWVTLKP